MGAPRHLSVPISLHDKKTGVSGLGGCGSLPRKWDSFKEAAVIRVCALQGDGTCRPDKGIDDICHLPLATAETNTPRNPDAAVGQQKTVDRDNDTLCPVHRSAEHWILKVGFATA